jgi:exopolyphosphatase/guanosine-5'-triphosphate,3'-diphosphate pyrophosphatase
MKLCVIDIGTNSLHTVFAEIHASGAFRVLGREKEMVRLGDGAMLSGKLTRESMAAGLAALKRFQHLAHHRGMNRILAVATSAVRESSNGGEFLDRIRSEINLKVRVITGREEARLIGQAVNNSIEFGGQNRLIADIGGGSLELILSNGKQLLWLDSFKLGANRLSQIFPLSDPPKKDELERLEENVKAMLEPARDALANYEINGVIGTSGTLMNLVNMLGGSDGGVSSERTPTVTYDALKKLYKDLASQRVEERRKRKGLDPKRADMIVHGLAVIIAVMKSSKSSILTACDKGLREGILYDFIETNRKKLQLEEDVADIRRRSVLTLMQTCAADTKHAEQTARLSLLMFDALKDTYKLAESDRELLEYAAMLHDIGYHVSFDKHHKHAFYLITNTEMNGFSAEDVQIMAWTARYHRRSVPKKGGDFGLLPGQWQKRICQMAAMLRLADALDHSHFALVTNLKTQIDRKTIKIAVTTDSEIEWEVYEAKQRKEFFEKTFDCTLEFAIRRNSGAQRGR